MVWQEATLPLPLLLLLLLVVSGLRARKVMTCFPRDISPSSCFAHEGSESTNLHKNETCLKDLIM